MNFFSILDNHYVVETDGLLIKNVTESDDGVYNCRAIVITSGELNDRSIRVEVIIHALQCDIQAFPC